MGETPTIPMSDEAGTGARTQLSAVFLMILCTIFSSAGQILQKFGVMRIDFAVPFSFFNLPLLAGLGSYAVGAGFMFIALRKGELSLLFPILATSYVWVSILSSYLFPPDSMNAWKWLGIAVIITSIIILGVGSSRANAGKPAEAKKISGEKAEESGGLK